MKEPRKIVLVLGNGFDMDLGLPTSYKSFYESRFCPKNYPAPIINHLNTCWPDGLDSVRWYDLENEFLTYYKSIHNPRNPIDFITEDEKAFLKEFSPSWRKGYDSKEDGLVQSLIKKGVIRDYSSEGGGLSIILNFPESPIKRDINALDYIKRGLFQYINSIDYSIIRQQSIAFRLLRILQERYNSGDFISVYSFNYTRLIMPNSELKTIPVKWMHGSVESQRIIVGTRDDPEMAAEYDFLQKVMDTEFNPPDIVSALNDSDEIIIFGHSLGENDRQYFTPFFRKQASYGNQSRKRITVITKDDKSREDIKRALQRITGGQLSLLYSINDFSILLTMTASDILSGQHLSDFFFRLGSKETPDHYLTTTCSDYNKLF